MVKGDWIKPGAIVIDCGINSKPGKFFVLILFNYFEHISTVNYKIYEISILNTQFLYNIVLIYLFFISSFCYENK